MDERRGALIEIHGVVQGVGFRPFVYGLATRHALSGWVRNTSGGVEIEVSGEELEISRFLTGLQDEAPPLAQIQDIKIFDRVANGSVNFSILPSVARPDEFQPISPDVSICDDCLAEMFDPSNRRFRYPFINCTNCGPRYTIIQAMPYDRSQTTMRAFQMCPACEREYRDPSNRRFHAEPIACPDCGPHIWLELEGELQVEGDRAILEARKLLLGGKILAIRGLGGFHLACDATNPEAIQILRRRKRRPAKPFALMLPDAQSVEQYCRITPTELEFLISRERPILLLDRYQTPGLPPIATEVAPGQNTLGVMLPYTPLHYLLLAPDPDFPPALVMTSGNLSEEPIVIDSDTARLDLAQIADGFLLHNREIDTRCDDSVIQVIEKRSYPIRRARGYAPGTISLPVSGPPVLATGGELKNTFCLTRDDQAILSPHIGDLESYRTLELFGESILRFEKQFSIEPHLLVCDLHPDYFSSRYADRRARQEGLQLFRVQHHHAHIASVMAENLLHVGEPVIGVAFDGTGLGSDGAFWGGEFLLADYASYQRLYHLAYVPLCGGDAAVREIWRLAYAWLRQSGVNIPLNHPILEAASQNGREILDRMIEGGINSPPTSSMGRLFDAVASLVGIRQEVSYEAQGAIELECLADRYEGYVYPFQIENGLIDPTPLIEEILKDLSSGLAIEKISARFHNAVIRMVKQVCLEIRDQWDCKRVALSGGVWQNQYLLEHCLLDLRESGFEVIIHHAVPTNDGGLALGQAAIALHAAEPGSEVRQ